MTNQFSSVQSNSCVQLFATPWAEPHQGLPVHHQLLELTETHVHWVGDAIQPSHPLSSPSPPALNLSQQQGLFHWVSSSHQWPKYWSFIFSISPSNDYSGLISFRMDWLDLLALQGILKNFLQHHSSKASILQCSDFFIVQHPHMTTRKTIALTRWSFVDKVMSLLFNMLSMLVIGEGNGNPLQYSCLENPMDGGAWATSLSLFTFMHWRRKWQPTPVLLLGESQGQQGLVDCRLWDRRVGHDWSDLAAACWL